MNVEIFIDENKDVLQPLSWSLCLAILWSNEADNQMLQQRMHCHPYSS
jgi:hypothetical protein